MKDLLKLLFELGILSRTPRAGPYHVGITSHETAAAHSFRMSALAYFMAQEEKADSGKILKMCLVHDFPETRLLNQTFIQGKFYSTKDRQPEVLSDQLRNLRGSEELKKLFDEYTKCETKEAKIVHDANTLEALIEAKEYMQLGAKVMERWFIGKKKELRTETGRKILAALQKEDIYWWTE